MGSSRKTEPAVVVVVLLLVPAIALPGKTVEAVVAGLVGGAVGAVVVAAVAEGVVGGADGVVVVAIDTHTSQHLSLLSSLMRTDPWMTRERKEEQFAFLTPPG